MRSSEEPQVTLQSDPHRASLQEAARVRVSRPEGCHGHGGPLVVGVPLLMVRPVRLTKQYAPT
jgi:hypothetical protein